MSAARQNRVVAPVPVVGSTGNLKKADNLQSPQDDLLKVAQRVLVDLDLYNSKTHLRTAQEIRKIIKLRELDDFWSKCRALCLAHWDKDVYLGEHARRENLLCFFALLLEAMAWSGFPEENVADIKNRRQMVSGAIGRALKAAGKYPAVAELDLDRWLNQRNANTSLLGALRDIAIGIGPHDSVLTRHRLVTFEKFSRALKTLEKDSFLAGFDLCDWLKFNHRHPETQLLDVLQDVAAEIGRGQPLSMADPLTVAEEVPHVGRGHERRQIYVEKRLCAIFTDWLGSPSYSLIATAESALLNRKTNAQDVGARIRNG